MRVLLGALRLLLLVQPQLFFQVGPFAGQLGALDRDIDLGAAELQRFAAEQLSRFKVPSTVVFREEPLPRNATGKILKRDLRDELLAR